MRVKGGALRVQGGEVQAIFTALGLGSSSATKKTLKSAFSVPTSTSEAAGGKVNSAAGFGGISFGVEVGSASADFTPSQAQRPTCHFQALILTPPFFLCTPFQYLMLNGNASTWFYLCFSLFY